MRWFKHLSRAHLDEAHTALIAEHGLECYGFYWLLLEVVSESMDKTDKCSATHPLPQWSRLLYSHHNKVAKYFSALAGSGLIEVHTQCGTQSLPYPLPSGYPTPYPTPYPPVTTPSNGKVASESGQSKVKVTIPNLLKYRDEYSKKSGHSTDECPESVGSKIERQKQIQIQKEKEEENTAPDGADLPLFSPHVTVSQSTSETQAVHSRKGLKVVEVSAFSSWFEREFWPSYPKKVGKAAARTAAKRKMTTSELMDRAAAAIHAQAPTVDDPRYFPNAATWFNQQRWEDEVYAPVRAETKSDRVMAEFARQMAYEAEVTERLRQGEPKRIAQ